MEIIKIQERDKDNTQDSKKEISYWDIILHRKSEQAICTIHAAIDEIHLLESLKPETI